MNQLDRVSFSFGMKLALPAKYESSDFHVSLASDVQPGETSVTAFNRVKKEVEVYAELAYRQIRDSAEGLTNDKPKDKTDVSVPAEAPKAVETKKVTQTDPKVLRQKIKAAFGVLEAQKKVTKADFVTNFLNGQKTDDLRDADVPGVVNKIRDAFPELKL